MKTYEVKNNEAVPDGFKRIRINLEDRHRHCPIGNADITLWQVERESEEEAAVRRMKHLFDEEKSQGTTMIILSGSGKTLAEIIDQKCPPPKPKETQLDWNTGEPIRKVHCWQISSGLWIASYHSVDQHARHGDNSNFALLINGLSAIGVSEEWARLNLSNAQSALKLKS